MDTNIKKTIFDPLIIVIAVAVIFAIVVNIYVFMNVKTQPKSKLATEVTTVSGTNNNTSSTTTSNASTTYRTTQLGSSKSLDSNAVKHENIVTDASITAGWKTDTGTAFANRNYTIKYPARDWTIDPSDYSIILNNVSYKSNTPGSYQVQISRDTDENQFTTAFGIGQHIKVNDRDALYAYKASAVSTSTIHNEVYYEYFLMTIGDSKYLFTVEYEAPNDLIGEQMISTFQIN